MYLYENCSWSELEDGSLLAENVMTRHGLVDSVYLGPGGIYAVVSDDVDPAAMYENLRQVLSSTRVRLYFVDKGEYLPASDTFSAVLSSDELLDAIDNFLHASPRQYTVTSLERMKNTLTETDAQARGYYTDKDGLLYLYRHGQFRRASEIDSDRIFKLCIFGGMFGLHRFAIGKWASGMLYVLTCGLFLVGWLFDLIQLFFGLQKDKHKNLLPPLRERRTKLRYLPIGLIVGLSAFVFWMQMFKFTPSSMSPSFSAFSASIQSFR